MILSRQHIPADILKSDRSAVVQPTKFESVVNVQIAKTIGLTVSDKLLVAADEG